MARSVRMGSSPAGSEKVARYWGVDAVRGLAMVAVVVYHFVYDLDVLGGYSVEATSGFWWVFATASAFAFVFLVGLSLSLSSARAGATERDRGPFVKYLRRGIGIFACGMLITAVFRVADLGLVIFGILHLIGASIVLAYPFLRATWPNLFLGLAILALGVYLQSMTFDIAGPAAVLISPSGIEAESLDMPDYRPLLPWFGVVLLGIFFGNAVYGRWRAGRPAQPPPTVAAPLASLGRHTLLVYLVHQPVLIAALWATGAI